jgi:hypothetical protein
MKFLPYSDTLVEIPTDSPNFFLPTFPLGRILIHQDSRHLLRQIGLQIYLSYCLQQHIGYRWVVIGEDILKDYEDYDPSRHAHLPIVSLGKDKAGYAVWIVTAADRSTTTITLLETAPLY